MTDPDFVRWLRANPMPDLQALVGRYGNGFSGVPAQAWLEFDQAWIDWNERRPPRSAGHQLRQEALGSRLPAPQFAVLAAFNEFFLALQIGFLTLFEGLLALKFDCVKISRMGIDDKLFQG
jgi:hypothetical protein